ncbi:MAG: ATP-binding protein [bacterium]|nr:ATP-binding protein [bacterium]
MRDPHLESWGESKSSGSAIDVADERGEAPRFAAAELRRRRSVTIILAFLSCSAGLSSGIVHATAGDLPRALFTATYGFLILGCLFGLRLGRCRPEPVAHAILGFTAIGMIASPLFSPEAIRVPIGLVSIPFSAILALGYRGGMIWTPLAGVTLTALALTGSLDVAERTLVWNCVIIVVLIGGVGGFIDRQRSRAEIGAELALAKAREEAESRSRTETSLAEREALLATVFARTPAMLFLVDLQNGKVVEVNERFTSLMGWDRDEAVGRSLSELGAWFNEDDMRRLGEHVIETGGAEAIESRLLDREGQAIDLLASIETLSVDGRRHWLVHAVDIRDRKRVHERSLRDMRERLEQQGLELEASRERIGQQEQLASVGTLAAGIAHQINNPIGGIRMIAETSLAEIDDGTASERYLAEALDRIVEEAARCGDIVKSILQFSRNEPMSRWQGDVNEAVRRSVRLMRPQVSRRDASIQTALCEEKLLVAMNPVAVDQILTNLVENAALSSDEPIEIRIETERRGRSAIISVADDGPGMDHAVLEHAFDPFFTTRLDRGGTGLGLSVVHGLVKDLGGEIEIESSDGKGVRVEIDLPLLEA